MFRKPFTYIEFANQDYNIDLFDFDLTDFIRTEPTNPKAVDVLFPIKNVALFRS